MFVKMPRLLLLASIICPSLASALGLGEIHLNSALNEPLRAQIDLIAAAPDELMALHASLASREAFTRYGIDRPAFESSFAFKVAKSADGRDVLNVTSTDAISEPFVTFLLEVNWARGRLMREYTVLLDPPTYTPGEAAGSAAPVTGATIAPAAAPPSPSPAQQSPSMAAEAPSLPASSRRSAAPAPATTSAGTYRTVSGDTLMRIARAQGGTGAQVDQTMMAIYKANPAAFDGNINVLHRGTILRLPGADEIAALNQREAIDEVSSQMSAWRNGAGSAASGGRLRLVTPKTSGEGTGSEASGGGSGADVAALKNRVKELEGQLAESRRLVDVNNTQMAELQRKLAAATAAAALAQSAAKPTPVAPAPSPPAPSAPAASTPNTPPAPGAAPAPEVAQNAAPVPEPASAVAAPKPEVPAAAPSGSWLDWIENHWQVPGALVALLLLALGITAFRRRSRTDTDELSALAGAAPYRAEPSARDYSGSYKVTESFGTGDTAEIKAPGGADAPVTPSPEPYAPRFSDETMSAESPVTIDQGDPIAEADFHMAYGLYDQAADLVRIALDREPDRRDLRMKLLEIYFVWGNAENFLQTAKELAATRDHAASGEWEKIMIMGKQICPDEEMFRQGIAGKHGHDSSVDLNLEGGENQVDIDLFGDATGEHAKGEQSALRAREDDPSADTGESPHLRGKGLDFVLDAPERGAEPLHEEPTIESEQMVFGDTPPAAARSEEHTAEVAIHDLGFDIDHLEATDSPTPISSSADRADQNSNDSATVIAGLDERSRHALRDADTSARDNDLTQLERELEASFIAELAASGDDLKPGLVQESAPTVNMAANLPTVNMPANFDSARTGKFERIDAGADTSETEVLQTDSTAKMRTIDTDDVDLDFSQLTNDGGKDGGDNTAVREVFDNSQRVRGIDLDLSENAGRSAAIPNSMDTVEARKLTVKGADTDIPGGEFAPVTMSEVGTKLDLARAYMDMGDPEGARSILEEVVQEGSASQKKEATRLIQSLPG